jgi:hypothetical protein
LFVGAHTRQRMLRQLSRTGCAHAATATTIRGCSIPERKTAHLHSGAFINL